jgi:hypothetical protein
LGNSERLGVTSLKIGHYKRPLQNAITKSNGAFRWIAKGAAGRSQGIAEMPLVFVYWTTSVS